jgi:hypothetical protein
MSKKIGLVVTLAGISALSLFLLSCGSSSSRPSGVVYALTQGSNGQGNNVSSFSMDLDSGALALVNSNASTCPTAADGSNTNPCGFPVNILLDPAGANAFVLDQGVPCVEEFDPDTHLWECPAGSNPPVPPAIYPYTVNSDGSLSGPGTGVTWTCAGVNVSACTYNDTAIAMSRDAAGQFLFVIDQGSFPSPGYPTPSPINPTCPHAPTSAVDVCPSISVFAMQGGTLTLQSGSPFYLSKLPSALSAIVFTPQSGSGQEFLFVTNNLDICTANCILPQHSDNTVSVYTVSSSGVLSEQPNSPYAIIATNPISVQAVNTNPAGQITGGLFVYVGNQGSTAGALNPFQVCTVIGSSGCTAQDVQNNLMTPLGQICSQPPCNNVPPTTVGQNPVGLAVDPTNNFLYVVSEGSNQVFGFKIGTTVGTLTALNPASEPTGTQPVSMALHPSVNNTGQFLFVSNAGSDNISGFTLNATSGSMSNPTTVIAPAAPSGIAVH